MMPTVSLAILGIVGVLALLNFMNTRKRDRQNETEQERLARERVFREELEQLRAGLVLEHEHENSTHHHPVKRASHTFDSDRHYAALMGAGSSRAETPKATSHKQSPRPTSHASGSSSSSSNSPRGFSVGDFAVGMVVGNALDSHHDDSTMSSSPDPGCDCGGGDGGGCSGGE